MIHADKLLEYNGRLLLAYRFAISCSQVWDLKAID